MKDKRLDNIDIAKGLGIIFVVLGHTNTIFRNLIYQFHMPLFFFLGGVVYKDKYSNQPREYIKNKIRHLYIPFVLYNLIFLIFHNIFINIGLYSTSMSLYKPMDYIKQFINIITLYSAEQMGGALWFLPVILWVSILFCILRYIAIKHEINREYFVSIIIVIFIIGKCTDLPRGISIACVALIFYYGGYLFSKYSNIFRMNKIAFVITTVIVVILSFINNVEMVINYYSNIVLMIISSFCGIYTILYISEYINKTNIKRWILYIGKNTLPIVALHFLAFKIVNVIQVVILKKPYNMISEFPTLYSKNIWGIIYVLVGILVPLIIDKIIKKYILYDRKNKLKVSVD